MSDIKTPNLLAEFEVRFESPEPIVMRIPALTPVEESALVEKLKACTGSAFTVLPAEATSHPVPGDLVIPARFRPLVAEVLRRYVREHSYDEWLDYVPGASPLLEELHRLTGVTYRLASSDLLDLLVKVAEQYTAPVMPGPRVQESQRSEAIAAGLSECTEATHPAGFYWMRVVQPYCNDQQPVVAWEPARLYYHKGRAEAEMLGNEQIVRDRVAVGRMIEQGQVPL